MTMLLHPIQYWKRQVYQPNMTTVKIEFQSEKSVSQQFIPSVIQSVRQSIRQSVGLLVGPSSRQVDR